MDHFDQTAIEIAVTITPCLRFCRKHGIISFFSMDNPEMGIQVMKKDFLRMFPKYTIEKLEGDREQAVAIVDGQRFFALLTEDDNV